MIAYIARLLDSLAGAISTYNPVGLLAIIALALLADVGLPIPLIIEPSLFLIVYNEVPLSLPVLLFIAMLAIGRQVGTAALYWLSRLLGNRFGGWASKRFPRFSRRFAPQINRLQSRVCNEQECGRRLLIVAVSIRMTPGLLPIETVVAGTLRWPYPIMVAATAIAGAIYDFTLVFLGFAASMGLRGLNPHDSVLVALILAGLVGLVPIVIGLIAGRRHKQG